MTETPTSRAHIYKHFHLSNNLKVPRNYVRGIRSLNTCVSFCRAVSNDVFCSCCVNEHLTIITFTVSWSCCRSVVSTSQRIMEIGLLDSPSDISVIHSEQPATWFKWTFLLTIYSELNVLNGPKCTQAGTESSFLNISQWLFSWRGLKEQYKTQITYSIPR